MTDEDAAPIDEFDRVFAESYVRNNIEESILGSIGPATATVTVGDEKLGFGLLEEFSKIMDKIARPEPPLYDLGRVDLVMIDPREDFRRFRFESMFPLTVLHEPMPIVRLYDFDRPSRDDFWDIMKFLSMITPIRKAPKRAKARRRFRVATIKRRNGWKRHLRKGI